MYLDEIDSFTESAVSDVCKMLQLTEPNSTSYLTTDPRVVICARAAYNQIANYINRDLYLNTHYEEYYDEDTTITLRCYPVQSIATVKLIDNKYHGVLTDPDDTTTLSASTDYRLVRNKNLVIYNLDTITDIYYVTTKMLNVYVEYSGGFESSEDDTQIHNALVTQTIANYNRIPALGLTQIEGGGGDVKGGRLLMNLNLVDAGQLLDSVKIIIDPFVYYGSAVVV